MEEKKLKRKIGRILALFLATMILVVTVGTAETIWPTDLDDQSGNRKPNMRVRAESLPNDPYWSLQWGLKKIEADWAWNATLGNSSILVAVIDSGIDYTHPDLAANYAAGLGYDWINLDTDPMDDYGHGTKVAGVIAAQINNGIGIAGLVQVKIMAEKVLDRQGEGYVDQLANAINHSTDVGAEIISMSLSTEYNGSLLYDAIKYAYEKNVLLVAAAGNQAGDTKRYPAAYDEVIAVTSTDIDDQKAPSSNYGDWVELAAPGVNIFTTIWDTTYKYEYASGTSVACPHVSGLAALIWSEFPNVTRDWIRTRLRDTADDLGDPGFDIFYGYGRINARKAIYGASPAINYTLAIATTAGGITNPAPGNYTFSERQNVSVLAIPNPNYILDYWELDTLNVGATNPMSLTMDANHTLRAVFALGIHDIAVTDVRPFKTVVGQGYSLDINVTIGNHGNFTETLDVTLYANTTEIGTKTITLASEGSVVIAFFWNTSGFAKSNYTIWAHATPVLGETDIEDNSLADGIVQVTKKGDLNSDDEVNVLDLILVAIHLGHKNGDDHILFSNEWYQCLNTDLNNDNDHNVLDLILVANYLGT
jgi:hypothetical protein